MKSSKLSVFLRPHLRSAGMGAIYSFLLHLGVWVSLSACYLAVPYNGNHLPLIILPLCVMLLGLIAFVLLKSAAVEPLTFYGVLLLVHFLMAMLISPHIQSLANCLDSLKGLPPGSSPEGNFNTFYFLLNGGLLTFGMGGLLFLLSTAFLIRDILRGVMGFIPKERPPKNSK